MNKPIKILLENLFDDFQDDIINSDESVLDTYLKKDKLTDCRSKEEIIYYFKEKYDLYNKLCDFLNDLTSIINNDGISFNLNGTEVKKLLTKYDNAFLYNTNYLYFYKIRFAIRWSDIPKTNSIIYRNKDITNNVKILTLSSKENTNCYWYAFTIDIDISGKKLNSIDQQFNNNNKKKYDELNSVINLAIIETYDLDRLAEELTCKPKVYKVTLKDVDRMANCLRTDNYTGLDKIKQPDKMAARLSAFFIAAHGMKDMELVINDDILLSIFNDTYYTGNTSHNVRGRYGKSYYIEILKRLRAFPTIHLKDILATYNAYVDKF